MLRAAQRDLGPLTEAAPPTGRGVSAGLAIALVGAAAALGGLGAAAVADATHKATHNFWHHGLGACCTSDGFVHPFMAEVDGTYRNSYVAWGHCCGHPSGYGHAAEQFDNDSHNHINLGVQHLDRYYFASVRSPVTALDHQHHLCGDGDCVSASGSENE